MTDLGGAGAGGWGGTWRTQGLKGVAKQTTALGHVFPLKHQVFVACEGRVRQNSLLTFITEEVTLDACTGPTKRLNPYVPSLTLHEADSPAWD